MSRADMVLEWMCRLERGRSRAASKLHALMRLRLRCCSLSPTTRSVSSPMTRHALISTSVESGSATGFPRIRELTRLRESGGRHWLGYQGVATWRRSSAQPLTLRPRS